MKKIIKKIFILSLLLVPAIILFGCDNETKNQNTLNNSGATNHNPSSVYSYDENYHYYTCEDAGCGVQINKRAHNYKTETISVATCTTNGLKKHICQDCGYYKTEEVAKLGHSFSDEYQKGETIHWHPCENPGCSAHFEEDTHKWNNGITITPASCDTNGSKQLTCYICDKTKIVVIEASGHNPSTTLSYNGTHHYYECTNNNCSHKENVMPHNYTSQITTPATCTTDGLITYTCSCGHSYTETIPTGGHSVSSSLYYDDTYHYKKCTNPGCDYKENITPHSHNSEITTNATCTSTGIKTYSCECGHSYTEPIPTVGHSVSSSLYYDDTYHYKKCTNPGCDYKENITPHSYNSEITTNATCTSTGIKTYSCECGHSYTDTMPIGEHSLSNTLSYDENNHYYECTNTGCDYKENITPHSHNSEITTNATCTSTGIKTYSCECGHSYTEPIPTGGHSVSSTIYYNETHHYKKCTNPGCDYKENEETHTFNYEWKQLPTSDVNGIINAICECEYSTEISGVEYNSSQLIFSDEHSKICYSYTFEHNGNTHTILDTTTPAPTEVVVSVIFPTKPNQSSVNLQTYTTQEYELSSNDCIITVKIDGVDMNYSSEELAKYIDTSNSRKLIIKFGYDENSGECYLIAKSTIVIRVTYN